MAAPCTFRHLPSSSPCGSSEPLDAAFVAAYVARHHGRVISFVGDSIVRQLFHHLVCLLAPYMDPLESRHPYWECRVLECLNAYTRVVVRHERKSVTLQHRWIKGTLPWPPDLETRLFTAAHTVVFGIGAFLTKSTASVGAALSAWNRTWLQNVQQRGGRVIWVEYFAGHFNSSDGEFVGSSHAEYFTKRRDDQGTYPCVPLSSSHTGAAIARANPRHAESNRFARAAGWTVVETFEQSASRHGEHPGVTDRRGVGNVTDCRHWSACSEVLKQRSSAILQTLIANDHQTTPPAAQARESHGESDIRDRS